MGSPTTPHAAAHTPDAGSLADWSLGRAALLVTLGDHEATVARAGQLGLRGGMTVTPLLRTPGRGLLVAAGELRVALDRASARAVRVTDPPATVGASS